MSKKLAIHGHATRGNEVIELLKMMGGRAMGALKGNTDWYMIDEYENNLIKVYGHTYIYCHNIIAFTLEEFLEKYPFKVGDKVVDCYGDPLTIKSMNWFDELETMVYTFEDSVIVLTAKDIRFAHNNTKPTKETITPTPDITANITDKNNCDIQCPDGFGFYDENGNLIGTKVMMRPKKPAYPKTYAECCDILGVTVETLSDFIFKDFSLTVTHTFSNSNEYYINLFKKFFELKLCYDAYRKIAGEELELGKPWEPDWNESKPKYTIVVIENELVKRFALTQSYILSFPTEEMRDVFYDNFKDLIEQCKELL